MRVNFMVVYQPVICARQVGENEFHILHRMDFCDSYERADSEMLKELKRRANTQHRLVYAGKIETYTVATPLSGGWSAGDPMQAGRDADWL